ncbi:hypothetical protein E1A91_D13G176300v1 [Gossypium mustelinum]|uniref:Uncharacterized protein n=1 Tax=Gossypium mustelinum TaxID=34275 RepID=A0A5D2S2W5_GOSMU|nr:hypothetical protein E1A91_D13G176300v1 [Gossypium mustelinum]
MAPKAREGVRRPYGDVEGGVRAEVRVGGGHAWELAAPGDLGFAADFLC